MNMIEMCVLVFVCVRFFFFYFSFFFFCSFCFLMIRRPPRSTLDRSSAASDVYKRQVGIIGEVCRNFLVKLGRLWFERISGNGTRFAIAVLGNVVLELSLIHISEPTRPY